MRKAKKILALLLVVTLFYAFPITGEAVEAVEAVSVSDKMNKDNYFEIKTEQRLSAVEETLFTLPDRVVKAGIDGVSIEINDTFVCANIDVRGNILSISPLAFETFEDGKNHTIRIFCSDGNRYVMNVMTQSVDKIDFSKDNVIKIAPNPEKGFNYPYYLFIPKGADTSKYKRLIVEPNNTGYVSDYIGYHEERVKQQVSGLSLPAYASDLMKMPMLMPVFPRPLTEWWDNYYHTLSREVMLQESGDGVRVDLQLIAMIQDAQNLLAEHNLKLEKKVFMTGFSASGQFVNRFTVLHPEWVKAVFHGGFTMYPTDKLEGNILTFPLGVADIEAIAGKKFNLEEYKKVAQFVYTGDQDLNDKIEETIEDYNAYDAMVMWNLYKTENAMQIWAKKESLMQSLGFGNNIQFHIYKGIGHGIPQAAHNDIIQFFTSNHGDKIVKINAHKDASFYDHDEILNLVK